MEKQKVFIPVEVEKELPEKSEWYFTYTEDEYDGIKYPQSLGNEQFDADNKEFIQEEEHYAQPSHWLKEQEGYFFTEDEFSEIQNCYRCVSKEEYDDAVNEISQLQRMLQDAENEIIDLNRRDF